MASQKWSRSMNWLVLSKKQKNIHKENLLAVSVDFEKYACSDSNIVMHMIREMGFSWELDTDNSNQETSSDYTMTLVHSTNPYWSVYAVYFNLPWFPSWQAFSFNCYSAQQSKVLKSQWWIEFVWAFFRFKDILKDQAPQIVKFYERVRKFSNLTNVSKESDSFIFRRNRIDIAIDLKLPVNQDWEKDFIQPNKNSKRVVHHYNHRKDFGWWQSFSYIPKGVSRGIGIRIYNKIIDIVAKNKQAWYPEIDVEKDIVTRVELVYYSPYAENEDSAIFDSATSAILGTWQHNLHYMNPCSVYSPLSAHKYITRYAKNHWTPLMQVLQDIISIENKP